MPRGDGTGPMGLGPMTGRGAGYCEGFSTPGYANPMPGRGVYGRGRGFYGRGRGRGWRYWQRATRDIPAEVTSQQEIDFLKNEADFLKNQLEDIHNRIEILEKAPAQDNKTD